VRKKEASVWRSYRFSFAPWQGASNSTQGWELGQPSKCFGQDQPRRDHWEPDPSLSTCQSKKRQCWITDDSPPEECPTCLSKRETPRTFFRKREREREKKHFKPRRIKLVPCVSHMHKESLHIRV
jgi:hypothetical protein